MQYPSVSESEVELPDAAGAHTRRERVVKRQQEYFEVVTMIHHAVLTTASVAERGRFDVGIHVDHNAHAKYGTSCQYLGLSDGQYRLATVRLVNVLKVGVGDELRVLLEVIGNETAEARHRVVGLRLSVGLALPPQEAVVEAIGRSTSLNCNGTDRLSKSVLNRLPIRIQGTLALRVCCADIDIAFSE